MRQYHGLKAKHPGALLFFRLGDFYELFFDDAKRASPVLEVVLTQRQGIPMCGVPHHALAGYLAKLLKKGFRIAIAEQMEDPSTTKGMVSRDVVRVVSPGTVLEDELLQAKQNNFLVAVHAQGNGWGLAAVDVSTGTFLLASAEDDPARRRLKEEIARLDPREILLAETQADGFAFSQLVTKVDSHLFHPIPAAQKLVRALKVASLAGFGLDERHPALPSAGAVLSYIEENHAGALGVLQPPRVHPLDDFLSLDENAVRHLDLLPNERRDKSLWDVIDHTATAAGGRKLKWWLLRPLLDVEDIRRRQDRVGFMLERKSPRRDLSEKLKEAADVERVLGRLATATATGRDLVALRRTLRLLPSLRGVFDAPGFLPEEKHPLQSLLQSLFLPQELGDLLEQSLSDDPPMRLGDGGVIRDGHNAELDELRGLAKNGRAWVSSLEAAERQRTGITSLKIGFTSVFGYYLEVSHANRAKVPPEWIRKQTLANAERFITPELKTQEDKILGAEDKARALEAEIFARVRFDVLQHREALQRLASALAELDALASLAEAADRGGYRRPVVNNSTTLRLKGARHPVVEQALAGAPGRQAPFVPNDLSLDGSDPQILLITGPNMAGKSTYLRQAALLVVLAQMGSYVPADEAEVGVVDRIFTRIGAGDNLAAGASTFMVEMQEVSNILHNATTRSLLILDEVGRGTSTYDGVAVAWAVLEHLYRADGAVGPKTLFATHYFELTELPAEFAGIKNVHASVKEWATAEGNSELVFLHQIQDGPADRSYGVHVAEMAGLPAACVTRAKRLLKALESGAKKEMPEPREDSQFDFFADHPVLERLKRIDPNRLTPVAALSFLDELRKSLLESSTPQRRKE